MFLMVDGIDGAGKSTVISLVEAWLRGQKKTIFDLRHYTKTHRELPEPEELLPAEILLSGEPTRAWVGRAIRAEMIFENGRDYAAGDVANAYALDRLILYRRCYAPLLKAEKTIISDRGVSTTLAYQTIGDSALSPEELMSLSGNALSLDMPPTHLLLLSCDVNQALARLAARKEKKDQAIFERRAFLERAQEHFHADWFRRIFASRGTILLTVDTSGTLKDTERSLQEKIFPLFSFSAL